MKKLWFILFMVTSFLPVLSYAGGSTYSRYGIGDILYYGGSRAYAMGGSGIATMGNDFINQLNPASLAKIPVNLFSGSFDFESYASPNDITSSTYNTFDFQSFMIAIPLSPENGVVLSFEATPYSRVSYAIQRTDAITDPITNLTYQSIDTYYGSGGIMMYGLGISYSPSDNLHLGIKFQNYNGITKQYLTANFNDTAIVNADYESTSHYNGFGLTIGTILENVGSAVGVKSLEPLTVGLFISTPVSLTLDSAVYYPSLDTSATTSGYATIPYTIGFGASYTFDNRYQCAADLIYQNWSDAKYFERHEPSLRDAMRIGFGIEAMPVRNSSSYWQRLAYRLGGYYYSTYYTFGGTGIDEFGATAGLGIPFGLTGKLDIGLQAGLRGTTDNNLQKDVIWRFSINVTVGELWFVKYEDTD